MPCGAEIIPEQDTEPKEGAEHNQPVDRPAVTRPRHERCQPTHLKDYVFSCRIELCHSYKFLLVWERLVSVPPHAWMIVRGTDSMWNSWLVSVPCQLTLYFILVSLIVDFTLLPIVVERASSISHFMRDLFSVQVTDH